MRAERPNTGRSERGVVIIWTALFLMVMLGFVALGIDVAKLTATRTQLQNAADAAALAGASAIDMTTGDLMPDTATVRAQAIANMNEAFVNGPKGIMLAAGDISFPTSNSVRVTVRRDAGSGGAMLTHVAQVLGIKDIDVQATATAAVEPAGAVCDRILPMGAIEVPGTPFQTGCAYTYNLKTSAGDINTPGNFQLLDFPTCAEGPCQGMQGGSNEVRCEVASGYSCCVGVGEYIDTKPGNSVGPFIQGLQDRWDRDSDRRESICYEEYTGTGDRIVVVPIFEEWDPNGSKPVKVARFSAFFLQRRPGGGGQNAGIIGQFLNIVVPGEPGTGTPSGTAYVLHLVE
jgi:Flp pilus assembly protein TadG